MQVWVAGFKPSSSWSVLQLCYPHNLRGDHENGVLLNNKNNKNKEHNGSGHWCSSQCSPPWNIVGKHPNPPSSCSLLLRPSKNQNRNIDMPCTPALTMNHLCSVRLKHQDITTM